MKDFEEIYVVLANGVIGKVKSICTCDECKRRGETELFIDSIKGEYRDCIRFSELFDRNVVLNMEYTIHELSNHHLQEDINHMIAEIYQQELLNATTNSNNSQDKKG